jgi:predicted O-methyltransferase YrrM
MIRITHDKGNQAMELTRPLPVGIVGRWRHRTPRYVYHRTRQMLYERGHPDAPWLTPEATRLLTSMLRPSDQGVEFGSGRSTVWFAERVSHLTSVEDDSSWYSEVSARLRRRGLSNVEYLLKPRDQPLDESGDPSEYARVALTFPDASVDFGLVDGQYRGECTRLLMPKIKPGGLLIIDNINWYLPSRFRAPGPTPIASRPDGVLWQRLGRELAQWRPIWTGSGVWDTAIFVKP